MGQPVSKPATTAPFENYHIHTGQVIQPPPMNVQGPPVMYVNNDFAPPPGPQGGYQGPRQDMYPPGRPRPMDNRPLPRRAYNGPPPSRRGPGCGGGRGGGDMDEMEFFDEEGFDFDPFAEDRQPRIYTREELNQPGRAQQLIDDVRQRAYRNVGQERAPRYRSAPPPEARQQYGPPPDARQQYGPPRQPRITKKTTYIDEPAGYVPPGQQGYSQQQPVVIQAAPQQQQQQSSQQPIVLHYDPATGAIQQPAAQQPQQQYAVQAAAPAQPQVVYAYQQQQQQPATYAYQQPYQQQVPMTMAYPQMQGMQQAYMMPQQNQGQPIVIPMQVHSG